MSDNSTIFQKLTRIFGYPTGKPKNSFDFNIDTNASKEEIHKQVLTHQQAEYLQNNWGEIEKNVYNKSQYYEPNRQATFIDVENMEYTPEISAALDIFSEESCLTGDTLIPLHNGKIKTIKELYDAKEKNFGIFSYNFEEGEFVQGFVSGVISKGVKTIYKLTLEGGKTIKCTDDHQWLGENDKWIVTSELKTYKTKIKTNIDPLKVLKIEKLGEEEVFDLTNSTVDENFCILVDDVFVISHNCTLNEKGEILSIYSESDKIKEILHDLFINRLDINTNLQMWIRNLCKYGDNFVHLKVTEDDGIIGCQQLPNIEIQRNEGGKGLRRISYAGDRHQLTFTWLAEGKSLTFQSWEIAHFRLLGDDRKLPYGQSILEKIRRIWKQLILAEDAMLVYRTSRAPERRVFKIFVGNMDDADVQPYIQKIANRFKRDSVVDPTTGNVDTRYNQMAVDQDYFIPTRHENASSPIETLPGACIALDTEIPLLDGRVLPLQEIINAWDNGDRDLWVYSCNPNTGKVVPGLITWAGVTRRNAEVLKITLSNGETIVATPDHKFVHSILGFVEAQELQVNDTLMHFTTRKIQGINKVWDSEDDAWRSLESVVKDFFHEKNIFARFLSKFGVYHYNSAIYSHKNRNTMDNRPHNLKYLKLKYSFGLSKESLFSSRKLNSRNYSRPNNVVVTKIEKLEQTIDTGTLTIDGAEILHNYHTFATTQGIFIKNSNLSEIADIEYIQKKMLAALRVPKAFLGFEDAVGEGKSLALQDIRFARTVTRVQKSAIQELNKIAIIHLTCLGYHEEVNNFELSLTNPSTQSDLLKIEQWKEKVTLYKEATTDASNIGISPVSHTYAKKHILGFSDREIMEDMIQQRMERAVGFELQNTQLYIKRTGLFDNIDGKYGIPEEERQKIDAQPADPNAMGGGGAMGGGMDDTAPAEPLSETTYFKQYIDNLKKKDEKPSVNINVGLNLSEQTIYQVEDMIENLKKNED